MKLLVLLFSLLLMLPGARGGRDNRPTSRPRRPIPYASAVTTLPKLGRCSGDASCTACSSCEYCGHCAGGGGTCGVCSSSAAPVRRVSRTVRPSYRVSSSRGGGRVTGGGNSIKQAPTQLAEGLAYYVAAETLNLRAEPSADAEIVRVLTRNDIVTVLELTDAKWTQIRVTTDEGDIEGYVARAYLSEQESH
jgi:hypothetical protein